MSDVRGHLGVRGRGPSKLAVLVAAVLAVTTVLSGLQGPARVGAEEAAGEGEAAPKPAVAVIITCRDMVDEGMHASIKRRTAEALAAGATYIIYEIETFGGRVDSGISIHDYFLTEVRYQAHTVAYLPGEAISAGALISVACQDIVMRKGSKIGDCAPILMGGKLEGVEREKMESPLREYFEDAAQTNGYPAALCEAMVTADKEVWRVKHVQTGEYEYLLTEDLPKQDPNAIAEKELIVKKGELATFHAADALEYGLARVVAEGPPEQARQEMLSFLEERDNVVFNRPVASLHTNWSEEMVRWLTNPAVAAVLLSLALLGVYVELNTPGLGLAGGVALAALAILFGSKFLIGMANWWEIAVFVIGIALLMVEIFVIPGFGVAGISGILLMVFSLGAMMVQNAPDQLPIPVSPTDWGLFEQHVIWSSVAFFCFLVIAYFLGRFLPQIPVANRLILAGPGGQAGLANSQGGGLGGTNVAATVSGTAEAGPAGSGTTIEPSAAVEVGQCGISLSPLRPGGNARFAATRLTVVSRGELIESGRKIRIVAIEGNRIVVQEVPQPEDD